MLGVSLAGSLPHVALADDRPQVVFVDGAGNTVASTSGATTVISQPTTTTTTTTVAGPPTTTVTTTTTSQTVIVPRAPAATPPAPRSITWFGFSLGAVATPFSQPSYLTPKDGIGSNHFRACLVPGDKRYCSSLRGFDARVQIFNSKGAWDYPRWIGYFRTGYRAGRADFDPQAGGYAKGDATSLSYASVPLFFGGSVYAFKRFPIRPFAGLGVGIDVTRASYGRYGERGITQTGVRPGIEIHAGLEARVSNFLAVTFEAQQQWSMRTRLQNMPSFSTSALTLMAGVAVSLPSPGSNVSWRDRPSWSWR